MIAYQPSSVEIAKNLFVLDIDGRDPVDHDARIALVATLIEDAAYDGLSHHQICADLIEPIAQSRPSRLQRFTAGFAETVFQEMSEVSIVPITSQEEMI